VTLASIYTGDLAHATSHAESVAHLYRGSGRLEEANWHLCRALIATESADAAAATSAYDAALAIHRTKPPTSLFALTLALAALMALDDGDVPRALALDAELAGLTDEVLSGEEFPHLMYWVRSRAASLRGAEAQAKAFFLAAERLYEARVAALGPGVAAFAAVPWNARFLTARTSRSDAFQTLPS